MPKKLLNTALNNDYIIYESMGMHELDLGIAMAHFELTSQKNGLAGSWVIHSEAKAVEDLQYMISWKI